MKTKNMIFRLGAMAGVALTLLSCSEEKIFQPSQAGIPKASDYSIGVSVDDLNNVELNILDASGAKAKGVYPIWYVNESSRPSTALTYRDLITIAGDYPVEMKVGNANGVSEGSVTSSIHIDKTIFDFTPYMSGLTGGSAKEWAVDGTKDGNMGCGPDGSNPTGWWNGGPGAKEAEGVYANTLTFGDTGNDTAGVYIFDPGTSGTIYVNTGVDALPGYDVKNPHDGNDFRVDASAVETTFALVAEGANLYLTLPAHTPFPYIPSEAAFNNPKYRIAAFSKSAVTLVQDLDGISWQYIIAPKAEADVTTAGFKYDFEHNLWKDADVTVASTWFADGSWTPLPDQPEVTVTPTKGISFHTPAGMGNDQWQGQVHVATNIEVQAGINYDFSCNVNVPKKGGVTVKVQKDGDDETYFTADRVDVEPGGHIVWFSDLPGFDGTLKIAFDFGGLGDCDITVDNIVFKEHQYDDGTLIPSISDEPEAPVSWVDVDSDDNLFHTCQYTNTFWYAPDWNQIADPELSVNVDSWTLTLPEATTDQWQAQFAFNTDITTSAEKHYDVRVTFYSSKDLPGVTFKCVLAGGGDNDNIYYMADRLKVEAYDDITYKWVNLPGIDMDKMNIVLDFGGNPAGTEVTVKDIIVQEHRE